MIKNLGRLGLLLLSLLTIDAIALQYHLDPKLVSGPEACSECHEKTTELWKKTHHGRTFKELPRAEKTREIAAALGVKRVKTAPECSGCHFTAVMVSGKPRAIAGVSCESCHGAAKNWVDVHSEFGGKNIKAEQETAAHKKQRFQRSEVAGMIRPKNMEGLIRNCYSCHMIADEKLVNVGGHSSSSSFEIVRWSQGEVRHNVWYTDNNDEASVKRRRKLFLLGQVLNYEYALQALAKASANGDYAKAVAKQAKLSERRLAKISSMIQSPELVTVLRVAANVTLKLNNASALQQAAKAVSKQVSAIATNYDGSEFLALDKILPKVQKYKGKVQR